ncbi:MAG: hypothetical protein M1830_010045 [Pleopsidium flavum]|nr:MAG: hypothetical protein M1830_010045 [Pleopsidium flavum]
MEKSGATVTTAHGLSEIINTQDAHKDSGSQDSRDSQTASEFIDSQLQLEADAREALPYAFDTCTQPLGSLRQNLFSCLTCNPPPVLPTDPYTPAGVCYSCSIACHGEHTLVELFSKRSFTCDCGTTRLPATSPCTLRINQATGTKGGVHSETPAPGNAYGQNFRNRFCGCGELYDAQKEKGTMYQCLGLGSVEDGGCGEDWWHPECIVGLKREWYNDSKQEEVEVEKSVDITGSVSDREREHEDPPQPPGFPHEDDFHTWICYKCVDANPWTKRYAGTTGFLPAIYHKRALSGVEAVTGEFGKEDRHTSNSPASIQNAGSSSRKRKAESDTEDMEELCQTKKQKHADETSPDAVSATKSCRYDTLPDPPIGVLSLFLMEDFRDHFCRCWDCFPRLAKHQQLLEEEEVYEPPLSESGDPEVAGGSVGTGSLLDRGEAALSNVDRVRAIEGVMVYNHLKDKVKSFLQPFAESGQAVGAEDIKAYFEKLRGDAEAIKAAGGAAAGSPSNGDVDGDNRKEQSGLSGKSPTMVQSS